MFNSSEGDKKSLNNKKLFIEQIFIVHDKMIRMRLDEKENHDTVIYYICSLVNRPTNRKYFMY